MTRGGQRGRFAQVFILGLLALATVGLQLSYGEPGLLFLGPFLVLFAVLTMGLYPGERLLLALTTAHGRPRPSRRLAAPRPQGHHPIGPRGGALLAASLAGRAPPL